MGIRRGMMWGCVAVFLLSLAGRGVYVAKLQPRSLSAVETLDGEMERAAANWVTRGTICDVHGEGTGASAHVAPLYPALLAMIYKWFGVGTVSARLVQQAGAILVTAGTIAMLPWVARRLRMSVAGGFVAAVVLAISPLNPWIETSGSWEQPYTAAGLIVLVLTLAGLHDRRWKSRELVAVAGIVLGIAALLSPVLLLAGLAMIAAEVVAHRGRRMRVMAGGAGMVVMAGIVILPWMYRNYRELGGWVPLRSNFGLELWVGNNPGSNGLTHSLGFRNTNSAIDLVHPGSNPKELQELMKVGELAYMRHKGEQARQWIADNPRRFGELTVHRCRLFWFPTVEMWDPGSSIRSIKAGVFGALAAGAFVMLVWLMVGRNPYGGLMLAGMLGYSAIYMITHVDARYRYPLFALTALLSAELLVRGIGMVRLARRSEVEEEVGADRETL